MPFCGCSVGQHGEKMDCIKEVLGVTAISTQPKRGQGPYYHVEAAVEGLRHRNMYNCCLNVTLILTLRLYCV